MMLRAYKYRLEPNANQERELAIALESHRRLYNHCLDMRELAYQCYGASITWLDQQRWYTRVWRGHPYYSRLNNNSANETIKRLDKAYQNFFRRVREGDPKPGYPRFQGSGRFNSVRFGTYPNGAKLLGTRLRVQHVGDVKIRLHRPVEGKIKTVAVKKEADHWYVVFFCELPKPDAAPSTNPPVGIDVGLESFFTTSDGEQEPNPRYLKAALPALRRQGRRVSRKKKGGSNRRKEVRRLRKVHVRVRNLRREHHHQTALKLVHRFGKIAAEHLTVKNMVRNRRLARAIQDAGWSGFLTILQHKAECAGVEVVQVEPRGTSQECSRCGQVVPKPLSQRRHDCPHCGLSLHRDHNAALVILARAGVQGRTGPAGPNGGAGRRARRRSDRVSNQALPKGKTTASNGTGRSLKDEHASAIRKPVCNSGRLRNC